MVLKDDVGVAIPTHNFSWFWSLYNMYTRVLEFSVALLQRALVQVGANCYFQNVGHVAGAYIFGKEE